MVVAIGVKGSAMMRVDAYRGFSFRKEEEALNLGPYPNLKHDRSLGNIED